MNISLYANARDTVGSTCTVEQAIATVRGPSLKAQVECFRSMNDDTIKRALPAVTFAGVFSQRKASGCVGYTGVVVIDIDGKDQEDDLDVGQLEAWRGRALGGFVSPSGRGFKLLFATDCGSATSHGQAWAACAALVEGEGFKVDASGKDVSRLCFLSYDPKAWYDPLAPIVKVPVIVQAPDEFPAWKPESSPKVQQEVVTANRHQWLLTLAGRLARSGISEDVAIAAARAEWSKKVNREPQPNEIENAVKGAFAKGWQHEVITPEHEAELASHGAEVVALLSAQPGPMAAETEVGPWPDIELPGIGAAIMRDLRDFAPRYQPVLAMGAALSLVAAIAARKVTTKQGACASLYILGLAATSGGKDAPQSYIRNALALGGALSRSGPGNLASGAAIESTIRDKPAVCLVVDEIGPLLQATTSKKAARHEKDINTNLLKLFTSCNSHYMGMAYADIRKRETCEVWHPHLNLYASGNPTQAWEGLTPTEMASGLIPRFLVLTVDDNYPTKNSMAGRTHVSDEVVAWIKGWMHLMPADDPNVPADMRVVPLDDDAESERKAFDMSVESSLRSAGTEHERALLGKLVEVAARIALVLACMRAAHPADVEVNGDDWRLAKQIAWHAHRTVIRDAGRNMSDNDWQRWIRKAIAYIVDHGEIREAALKAWLVRQVSPGVARQILEGLGDCVEVRREETQGDRGRPAAVWKRSTPA